GTRATITRWGAGEIVRASSFEGNCGPKEDGVVLKYIGNETVGGTTTPSAGATMATTMLDEWMSSVAQASARLFAGASLVAISFSRSAISPCNVFASTAPLGGP